MRTKKPPKLGRVVTDPQELAILRTVQNLSPEQQADFCEAVRLMDEDRPAAEQRAAWRRFFQNSGYSDPQERAAAMVHLAAPDPFAARLH